jgi:hypothetical protein
MTNKRVKNMLWQPQTFKIYHLEYILADLNLIKLSL